MAGLARRFPFAAARAAIALAALLALAVVFAQVAAAAPTFPQLTGRVVDDANLLSQSERDALTAKLKALEDKTSTQLVVVTLPSLQGYDIADYGYQLGRAWGIGQEKLNNGALLIVAPKERKVRIEVGYGLEGTLTDAVSSLIIQNAILPRFRAGDMVGGIERGVDDLIQVLSGDAEDFKKRAAAQEAAQDQIGFSDIITFLVILAFLYFWFRAFTRSSGGRSLRRGQTVIWPMPGGFGGGWGGGFGGGFSGGGGSFGGGGSSGSW